MNKLLSFTQLLLFGYLAHAVAAKRTLPTMTPFEFAATGTYGCCPKFPTQDCDFAFSGYTTSVPTFHIRDGYNGDHIITPSLASAFHWVGSLDYFSPGVIVAATGQHVVANTNKNGTFYRCDTPYPKGVNAGNQFYLDADGGDWAKLWVRKFQRKDKAQHGPRFYRNKCINLQLTEAYFPRPDGTMVSLYADDNNTEFPHHRRCVSFKTAK